MRGGVSNAQVTQGLRSRCRPSEMTVTLLRLHLAELAETPHRGTSVLATI